SIVDRGTHVIDGMHAEVFDVANDRAEKNNVIARERRALASAREAIAAIGGAFAKPEAIDAEEAKKLAALGYVSGGADESARLRAERRGVAARRGKDRRRRSACRSRHRKRPRSRSPAPRRDRTRTRRQRTCASRRNGSGEIRERARSRVVPFGAHRRERARLRAHDLAARRFGCDATCHE